ncbi:MAG: Clp protease N-terminal domain-containing protein [Phycisphaerales bacterium]
MALSNMEAQRLHAEYIGTEHILLGLVREGSGVGANILKSMEFDLGRVRREVERRLKDEQSTSTGKLPQTTHARKVIENAISEARKLGHAYVGTEHILLGLALDAGTAGAVLRELGVTIERARDQLRSVLTGTAEPGEADPAGGTHELIRDIAQSLRMLADRLDDVARGGDDRAAPEREEP